MKTIQQTIDCPITVARFDTGENVTFTLNVPIEVDDDTANYLLGYTDENGFAHPPYKTKDEDGEDAANFVEVPA